MQQYGVTSARKLFPSAQNLSKKKMLQSFNGKKFQRPSLHNIFKLQVVDNERVPKAIEALKVDPNVEYAEPNYFFSIVTALGSGCNSE